MIAELKIYGNPSSLEPTKTYTLYRLTPHTWNTVQDFLYKRFSQKEMEDNSQEVVDKKYTGFSNEEMQKEAERLLKIFFPEITYEEVEMLDYGDGSGNNGQFYEFVSAIYMYGNSESNRSLKN